MLVFNVSVMLAKNYRVGEVPLPAFVASGPAPARLTDSFSAHGANLEKKVSDSTLGLESEGLSHHRDQSVDDSNNTDALTLFSPQFCPKYIKLVYVSLHDLCISG